MKHARRKFLRLAGAAIAAPAFSIRATAQTFPTRPITMIVPYPAGGSTDVIGRLLAERMRKPLGQPVIVENITGADGSIGTGRAARARPDGYSIGFGTVSTHVLNGALYQLQYDVLHDFLPVTVLVRFPYLIFAKRTFPANDLNGLISWLKTNPDKASAGVVAASAHLLTVLFQKETGTRLTIVPYRGVAPARQDLVAGQIDLAFDASDALTLMRSGSVKAYAVASDTRLAVAPEIPTFAELGLPMISFSVWSALFAPKGTASEIIAKLNAAAAEALADPAVHSRIGDLGFEMFPRAQQTPEALGALVKADAEKWWPLIKEFGLTGQ